MGLTAILGIGVGVLALGSLGRALSPLFNLVSQEAFKKMPNELLPPVNLINLRHRGLVSDSEYQDEMRKQGIESGRAQKLFEGAEMLLNGYEIATLYRRGAIDEQGRDAALGQLGFTSERSEQLMRVTAEIPSARDVIAFAVREVYSPQIAQAFGQFEGVDEVMREAADDIKASGMTDDAFKKFWAAHWLLPSVTQGYEMMHREIITSDELDQLMVALDIMPWWREKLREMSFAPFTRVDVRRMHKLGTIDDEGLVKAYKDVGYDDEKAEALADFTRAYNQEPEAAEQTVADLDKKTEKEATRAAVIKAYRDKLITRGEALTFLADLGYSEKAITLYIASEDFEQAEEITDDHIKTVRDAYVRRIYDFNKAIEQLGVLNLPAAQVDVLMETWNIERDARASRPSKAELFKMHKKKIIPPETLRIELVAHGFSDKYIDWYMELET